MDTETKRAAHAAVEQRRRDRIAAENAELGLKEIRVRVPARAEDKARAYVRRLGGKA